MRAPSIAAAAVLAFATPAASQSMSPSERQIRATFDSSVAAWNRGDFKGHLAINADSVWFVRKSGITVGNAKALEVLARDYFRNGKPIQTLRYNRLSVRPLGQQHALVVGQFVVSGGGKPELSGWFTTVCERRPEGWRIIVDHTS